MTKNKTNENSLPPYTTRISQRAKYLQIKISAKKGVEIIVPKKLPRKISINDFIQSKRDWIIQQYTKIANLPHKKATLPKQIKLAFLNECWQVDYQISLGKSQIIERTNHALIVLSHSIDFTTCKSLLIAWLKKRAKNHLLPYLNELSKHTNLPYQCGKIRTQKTRWGSCSMNRVINLNSHLLFLPCNLVTYVLIHELAHTIHLNHLAKFWALVAKHDPHYIEHEKQLKHMNKHVPDWALV